MKYLVDTNILLRLIEVTSPQHAEAENAVDKLLKQNNTLYLTLQNISEFWNVCTRPVKNNGLGFSVSQTDAEVIQIEQVFDLLSDTKDVYKNWRELVVKHSVLGIQVRDAKIVAAMKAHDIENLLTFNTKDETRFTGIKAFAQKDIL